MTVVETVTTVASVPVGTTTYDVQITGFDPDSASGQSNLGPDYAP